MKVHIQAIGGVCPIQAEGTINNAPFFFRARGNRWTLGIGGEPVLKPESFYSGNFPDAGWMSEDSARALIETTAKTHAQKQTHSTPEK